MILKENDIIFAVTDNKHVLELKVNKLEFVVYYEKVKLFRFTTDVVSGGTRSNEAHHRVYFKELYIYEDCKELSEISGMLYATKQEAVKRAIQLCKNNIKSLEAKLKRDKDIIKMLSSELPQLREIGRK